MKKIVSIFFGLLLSTSVFAGFVENQPVVLSVADVLDKPDDSYVTVEGNIVKRIKKDKYTFQDTTGDIVVEIDEDVWEGRTVTPDTRVRLSGEVDKEFTKRKIDVSSLTIVK